METVTTPGRAAAAHCPGGYHDAAVLDDEVGAVGIMVVGSRDVSGRSSPSENAVTKVVGLLSGARHHHQLIVAEHALATRRYLMVSANRAGGFSSADYFVMEPARL